jgi:hypothetical protein
MSIDINNPKNLDAVLLDVLDGDVDLIDFFQIYDNIEIEKIQQALDFIINNDKLEESEKLDLINNSWRIKYRVKPPTPEEFLSAKYLGEYTASSLYPWVYDSFIKFANDKYRNAVLFPFIGFGKSVLAVLWNLYTTTHLALMYDAKRSLMEKNIGGDLAQVFCSFNLKKSSEVLLNPMINILEGSEFFEQVRTKRDIANKQKEYQIKKVVDKLYWTTASRNGVSSLQFSNGVNYKLASTPGRLLGLTIVCCTFTELNFFRENGKSDDYIMRFYNDAKKRVWSRMKDPHSTHGLNYFARTILDSSPNDLESPVDQYCMFEAEKDSSNFVIKGAHWDWVPQDYKNINDKFPIFKGSNGKPPQILISTEGYDASDIIMAPRELYQMFHDDLQKSLKDLAGIPQGSLDKLFYDYDKINSCFISGMRSIENCLHVDARMEPHELIWKMIRDTLFVKSGFGYHFYYKPGVPRVFHIDQSLSNDMSAIAFVHVERKKTDKVLDIEHDIIYVVDMVIPIHPFGGRINLDAIKEFIFDVFTKGQIPIIMGSYDTYQSEAALQHLERAEIEMDHISVDETMDPYLFLAQQIEQGNLKMGRNVFIKNNLKSLRITQRPRTKTLKIDHTIGDSPNPATADYAWETSLLGINAKDCSDAIAGAVYLAHKYLATDGQSLLQIWDDNKITLTNDDIKKNTEDLIKKLGFI